MEQRVFKKALPVDPELDKALTNAVKGWSRDRYLEHFEELLAKMLATTKAKNNDYAGADDPFKNFREFGTLGFLVRMSDKWSRIKNLLGGTKQMVKDESVEDTLIDLATYSLLLICWLKGRGEE